MIYTWHVQVNVFYARLCQSSEEEFSLICALLARGRDVSSIERRDEVCLRDC